MENTVRKQDNIQRHVVVRDLYNDVYNMNKVLKTLSMRQVVCYSHARSGI